MTTNVNRMTNKSKKNSEKIYKLNSFDEVENDQQLKLLYNISNENKGNVNLFNSENRRNTIV